MPKLKRRTVLFADLRGSTSLYESLGTARAAALVTRSITSLAPCIDAHGGQLVKTLGDGLMAVFPQPPAAAEAALAMQGTLAAQAVVADAWALQLQVAVASGEIVEVASDCYGDAVNIAARLLDHAGDHEMLVTADVWGGLSDELQARFRSLDKMRLRGRNEPVHVYMLSYRGSETAATQLQTQFDLNEAQGVQLHWQGLTYDFPASAMPVLIGRASDATLRIDDARVSRLHVRINVLGGALQLTDLSINGTYVRFAGDDEVLSLRRGHCTLHGSGAIGLGGAPDDGQVPAIGFDVLLGEAASSSTKIAAAKPARAKAAPAAARDKRSRGKAG